MILAPNLTNVVGVFTMGFGIMTSVVTNNVSALAALANGLLPLHKFTRAKRGPSSYGLHHGGCPSRRKSSRDPSHRGLTQKLHDPPRYRIIQSGVKYQGEKRDDHRDGNREAEQAPGPWDDEGRHDEFHRYVPQVRLRGFVISERDTCAPDRRGIV
jgi:hypothetical protein